MIDILKKRFTENKERHLVISFEEAEKMGVRLMNEEEYRYLQTFGEFDLKTSSWVVTPERIRCLGGAIFCERRYNEVFTFHNGADSHYSSRAFLLFYR